MPYPSVKVSAGDENLGSNPGWQAWNMSKRVAEARTAARAAHQLVDDVREDATSRPAQEAKLDELVSKLDAAAQRARGLWSRILAALAEAQPGAIEETTRGVSVLRNSGPDPALVRRLWEIWGSDHSIDDARNLYEQIQSVAGELGKSATTPPVFPHS